MKNNRLPSKKEWDKIIDDAFSSEDIHQFSESYLRRKARLQKGIIMNEDRRRIKETPKRKIRISAVAGLAAALALVPASVLTISHLSGNKVPHAEIEDEENTLSETADTGETATGISEQLEGDPEEATTTAVAEDAVVSTTTEAVSTDFYAKIEPTAKYQNCVYVNYPHDGERINESFETEFTWLPEGMSCDAHGFKYHNGYGGGMTPCMIVVPETGVREKINYSVNYDQYETDDRVIMINYRNDYIENEPHDDYYEEDKAAHISFGRQVYVAFKGTKYVQMFYITNDIPEEDVRKIAEGVQLVPSDGAHDEEYVWMDYEAEYDGEEGEVYEYKPFSCNVSQIVHKKIGDTISDTFGGPEYGTDCIEKVDIKLKDAWLQDDFSGLNCDAGGNYFDYSQYLGADGKIWNERTLIIPGDGINTLDDVSETPEMQKCKVLVLDLEYINKGEQDITNDSFLSCVYAKLCTNKDGEFTFPSWLSSRGEAISDNLYSYYDESLAYLLMDGSNFCFQTDSRAGSANHVYISQGCTADVRLAFLVGEEFVGNIYVNFPASDEENERTHYFDLCGLK